MRLHCIGLSLQTAPVGSLDRLKRREEELATRLRSLVRAPTELLRVSSCCRVEVYLYAPQAPWVVRLVRKLIWELAGLRPWERRWVYVHQGADALRHLCRVAAGLDSVVMGERQIYTQISDAFDEALKEKRSGAALQQVRVVVRKAVRGVRALSRRGGKYTSMASAAVGLAIQKTGGLLTKKVGVTGAGVTSARVLAELRHHSQEQFLHNRTREKAEALARRMGGLRVLTLEELLSEADLVVCCTSSLSWPISRREVLAALEARGEKPLYLIDLSVPLNVDPEVYTLEHLGVHLFNVGDFQQFVDANDSERDTGLLEAESFVCHELSHWEEREGVPRRLNPQPQRDVQDVGVRERQRLTEVWKKVDQTAVAELSKAMQRLAEMGEKLTGPQCKRLEAMVRSIVNRLLHPLVDDLEALGSEGESSQRVAEALVLTQLWERGQEISRRQTARTLKAAGQRFTPDQCKVIEGLGDTLLQAVRSELELSLSVAEHEGPHDTQDLAARFWGRVG